MSGYPISFRYLLFSIIAAGVCALRTVYAHPVVSTDVNRHVTLQVGREGVELRYLYEMLEIVAVNVERAADSDGDGNTSDAERDTYVERWRTELLAHLHLSLGRQALPIEVREIRWELGPAPFGLHTWKISATLFSPAQIRDNVTLNYDDEFRPAEAGWKETVLQVEEGIRIRQSSTGIQSRSRTLTDYKAMGDIPNPEQRSVKAILSIAGGNSKPPLQAPHPARQPVTSAPPAQPVVAPQPRAQAPEVLPPEVPKWRQYLAPFFRLGMYHIAIGWDHLAFLLGLLLFRQSLGRLAFVITAFTLAHSLTLACAALGWINPPGKVVEALIAVSIAYVGCVSLWRPDVQHGPVIAFGFGLVHGFGFAGALAETLGEVDGRSWLFALGGFNLGIESFQLALVSIAYPLLKYLDKLSVSNRLRKTLSCIVIALGVYWSIERMLA